MEPGSDGRQTVELMAAGTRGPGGAHNCRGASVNVLGTPTTSSHIA